MKTTAPKRANVTRTTGVAVFLALALGGFYYLRMTANERALTDRNLRELDRIGGAVEDRVNNFESILKSLVREGQRKSAGKESEPPGSAEEREAGATATKAGERICEKAALIPDTLLECLRIDGEKLGGCPGSPKPARSCPEAGPFLSLRIEDEALRFLYRSPEGPGEETSDEEGAPTTDDGVTVDSLGLSWRLDKLEEIVRSELFDLVLLADARGRVFLSTGEDTGLRLHEIPPAEKLDKSDDSEDAAPEAPERLVSEVRKVTVAGEQHLLFLQPLRLDLPTMPTPTQTPAAQGESTPQRVDESPQEEAQKTEWGLAGLVSMTRFRPESLAFAPPHLLFLSLLLIAALLALPFLRVQLMGPRERLEVSDILYLGFSFILAIGVAGLGLADLAHSSRVGEVFDRQLESVARRLNDNLSLEISRAIRELDRQSASFCKLVSGAEEGEASDPAKEDPDGEPWMRASIFRDDSSAVHPDYAMVFWSDCKGQQVAKWTPETQNTSRVGVGGRAYFRAIREQRGWVPPPSPPGEPAPEDSQEPPAPSTCTPSDHDKDRYYLESIESLTTGKRQAVVSRPFLWPERALASPALQGAGEEAPCADDPVGIGAIIIPPLALDRPVLPAGFEFAVIEPGGRTLFHSRRERNLHENFFEEAGNDPLLRSAVEVRACHLLDADYMGRPRRLFARPLDHTELMLVVIMDQELLGTVSFEALFVAGAQFATYAFVLLLVFAVGEAILRRRMVWAWPDPVCPQKHAIQVFLYSVFAVSLVFQVARAEPHLSSLLVPFQALGLGLAAAIQGGAAARLERTRNDYLRSGRGLGWLLTLGATLVLVLTHLETSIEWGVLALQIGTTLVAAAPLLLQSRWDERALCRAISKGSGAFLQPLYTGTLLLMMLVVGALPGWQLLKSVFSEHLELLGRYQQLELREALQERERRLPARATDGQPAPGCELDLAFPPFLATCFQSGDRTEWICPDSCPAEEKVATDSCPGRQEAERARALEHCATLASDAWAPDPHHGFHELFHARIGDLIPFVTELAVEMRQLAGETTAGRWTAHSDCEDFLRLEGDPPQLASHVPARVGLPGPVWWLWLTFAAALFVYLSYWFGRRVFLSGLSHADPVGLEVFLPPKGQPREQALEGPHLLFVCTRSIDRSILRDDQRVTYIDLMQVPDWGKIEVPWSAKTRIVCIDFFDHRFDEPSRNKRLLELVESLAYDDDQRIFLLTSREPEDLLRTPDEADAETGLSKETLRRWERLLGRFVTVHVAHASSQKLALPAGVAAESRQRDWLEREIAGVESLRKIAEQIARRDNLDSLSEDAVIDLMREAAEGHYRALWAILRKDERLVVAQLAAGAVVNPKSEEPIRHLLARGLLRRDPELRLLNQSFGRFVRETVPAAEIRAVEQEGAASAWQQIRLPIFFALAAAAIFLFTTQQELFRTAMAFLSVVAVGAGAVLKLLTVLERKPAEPGRMG